MPVLRYRLCGMGTDGTGGGKFVSAEALAAAIASTWPKSDTAYRFVVLTGGEPLLQVDEALTRGLKAHGLQSPSKQTEHVRPHLALIGSALTQRQAKSWWSDPDKSSSLFFHKLTFILWNSKACHSRISTFNQWMDRSKQQIQSRRLSTVNRILAGILVFRRIKFWEFAE